MVKREAEIFGLLFLGDGSAISRFPLLNILASGKNKPVAVLEFVDCQGHLADGNKNFQNRNWYVFSQTPEYLTMNILKLWRHPLKITTQISLLPF